MKGCIQHHFLNFESQGSTLRILKVEPLNSKSGAGFTLIETLVYLGLFALVMGGIVTSAYFLFELSDRNTTRAMLEQEQQFLIDKIEFALSNAQSVDEPGARNSGASLHMTYFDSSVAQFCLVGSTLMYAHGAGNCAAGTPLNGANVAISNLVFVHTYAGGENPESVETGFTISTKTPEGGTISLTASTTVFLHR